MIAGKVQYYVYVTTEKKLTLNVTNAVEDLGWEENEKEISCRISFTMYNATYENQRLSTLIKIGQAVTVKANWGDGSKTIVTGFIKEAERDSTKSSEAYKIIAYDCLFSMQKSQDNVYYAKGKKTKAALTDIFKKWSVKIDKYTGPDVKHSKIVYKNKNLSDIVLGILDEAVKKGGAKSVVRASGNKVSILKIGSNSEVYQFDSSNCVESKYKISITSMVTRVKIVASKKDSDQAKVEAVVNGKTSYGVMQKIQTHASSDSLSDAKKAAREILDEYGDPKKTMTVQAPDVPPIYKGDMVHINAGSLKGDYIVKSIQHNAATGKMSMDVEAYKEKTSTESKKKKEKKAKYKVTARSGLNLRTAPNATIIATMPYGTTVTYNNKKNGNWLNVTYGSKTGYAYNQWLKKV